MVLDSASELLGREAVCSELDALVRDAWRGHGTVVMLEGDAGIGKSRLLHWLADEARAIGFDVASAVCAGDSDTTMLAPFEQVLRQLPNTGVAPTPLPTSDSTAARAALLLDWRDELLAASTTTPLLLTIDDVQRADVPSLLLLIGLASEAPTRSIAIVMTRRSGEAPLEQLEPTLAAVRAQSVVITLGGLPADAISHMMRRAGIDVDETILTTVVRRTGGNPLFVTELLRALSVAPNDSGRAGRVLATEVPQRVAEVFQRRVARLPTAVAEILLRAAVLGEEGSIATLATMADESVETTLDRLDAAVMAGLIEETAVGRWRFTHGLVRDAIYENAPSRARHALHDQAVAALEHGSSEVRSADLAAHALAALPLGPPDRAFTYSITAGAQARHRLAFEEAIAHLTAALEVLREYPDAADDRDRLDLLLALGAAHRVVGDVEQARAFFLEVARSTDDTTLVAAAALGYADPGADLAIAYREEDRQTADMLEHALAALGPGDSRDQVFLLARLSAELYFSSQPARSRPLGEQAVAMAERLDDAAAIVVARAVHHDAHVVGQVDPSTALAESTDILRVARVAADDRSLLIGHRARVLDLLAIGDLTGVDAEIAAFGRVVDESGLPAYRWWTAIWRAMRALLDGRHEEAEARAQTALEIGRGPYGNLAVVNFGFLLFFLRREQGRLAELESTLRAFAREETDVPAIAPSWALLLAEIGSFDEAQAVTARLAADDFARLRDRNWPVSWFQLCRVAFLTEDREAAAKLADLGRSLAGSCIGVSVGTVCLGAADLGLAWCADVLDDRAGADEAYQRADATNTRLGAASWLAQARLDRDLRSPTADQPTSVATFHRAGAVWELAYAGRSASVRHAKGLTDLATLLANAGESVHVLELLANQAEGSVNRGADEVFDRRAREQIKARLVELEAEADDATAAHDDERAARAHAARDALVDSLAEAVGLGGRARRLDDPAERARKTVTARIRNSIRRLEQPLPELAAHLQRSVDTGLWCVYRPERPVDWNF